jgi:LPXTG-motif cell wall-anchored protein
MNRLKVVATIFCLSLAALAFSASVKADAWNKKTIVTFSQPVEVPGGVVLPPSTYVFKLLDSSSNRHIVQIFNEDQNHIYATILAIPNYRLRVTGKTVFTFTERAAGEPQAIRAWFYPGDNFGQEFVYRKSRSAELAKQTNSPIPAEPLNKEPVVDLKQPQPKDVNPVEERVEIAQAVEQPPVKTTPTPQEKTADAPDSMEQLPKTASQLPFWGLIGLLSLGAGLALMGISKRRNSGK